MIYTVELLDNHALNLLRELEHLKIIRLLPAKEKKAEQDKPVLKEFKATRLDTRGFKFNREEANERS
jgi:hypothetical protein